MIKNLRSLFEKKSILHIFLFLMCCRNVVYIYPLYEIYILDQIYTYLALLVSVLFSAYLIFVKMQVLNNKILSLLLFNLVVSFWVTILYNGNIKAIIVGFYPAIGLFCFAKYITEKEDQLKKFINNISLIMLILVAINFALMGFSGKFYEGLLYFLGMRNQMSFTMLVGLYFSYLNKCYNKTYLRFYCYVILYVLTAFAIGSASGILAAGILVMFEMIPFLKKLLSKIRTGFVVNIIICALVFLIFMALTGVKNEFVRWVVEDLLHKDMTLTGRTDIWRILLLDFIKRPVFGYGSPINANLYVLEDGQALSAHNTFLAMLHDGGIVSLVVVFSIMFVAAKSINKIRNQSVSCVHKILLILISIPMMTEAVSINILYLVLFFGIALEQNEKNDENLLCKFNKKEIKV